MADWWDEYLIDNRGRGASEEKPWWEEYVIGRRVVPPQPKAPDTPPPNSLESAWERFKGSSRLGVAGLTQAAGWPEWTKALKEQADANEAEADRYQSPVPSYKDIYKEGDILGSIGRGGRYLYDTAVGSLPNMGATIVGGIAGAPLGPAGMAVGAIAANTPSYIGSNLREQMEQSNIPFEKTDILPAAGTAIVQSGLDALPVGRLGLGKAATGAIGSRIAKKAGEGALLEAPTEMLQEALQIVQANPQRLFDFSPEIQERLINAGVGGAALGGTMGGAAGAIKGRKQAPQTTQEEEPLSEPFSPSEYFPPPTEYVPNGTGLPIENTPLGLDSGTGLPEFTRIPEWTPMGTGLPVEPGGEVPTDMGFKPTADTGIAPVRIIEKNGQKVYDNIKDQLYGRFNPIQVNAIANFQRKRYEALGAQLGVSPWDAFAASNVTIDVSGSKPKIEPTTDPAVVLNQDETDIGMDEQTPVVMRSALVSALNKINMKEGTGQQWMNALKKAGVKDEEIEWTGGGDFKDILDDPKQHITKADVQRLFAPYKLAVYEAKPHDQGKTSHYGRWTLGEYGSNPESNYREVVISDEEQPTGTYTSAHYQMVPNALGHYRTTDRTLSNGLNALHMEEAQSDWHQEGRKRGYAGTQEEIDNLNNEIDLGRERYADAATGRIDESPAAIYRQINELVDRRNSLTSGVAKGPYQQSWPNMLFRHALADAINQDKDVLTWNTGASMPNVEAWGPAKKPGEDGYEQDAKRRKAMLEFYDKRIVDYANKLGKPFGVKVEKQTVSQPGIDLSWEWDGNRIWVNGPDGTDTYSWREAKDQFGQDFMTAVDRAKSINEMSGTYTKPGTSAEVWSLPINDTMREVLRAGGLPLFQREGATPKGNISLLPDKTIIRLFKNSDVSTVMHEFSHLHLAEMERYAAQNKEIAHGLATFKSWAGLEPDGKIGKNEQELWARGFEEYLATGKAPNAAMRDLFEQFKQWLIDIYKKMKNIVASRPAQYRDLKLTPDMRKVFDSLTTTKEQQTEERTTSLPPRKDNTILLAQAEQPKSLGRRFVEGAKRIGADAFDPQSRVPDQREYLGKRIETRGDMYRWDVAGRDAMKLYEKLTPDQQETVTQYFEGTKDITAVPQPMRAQTRAIKERIEKLGQDLVDKGVLKQETYDANKGSYSPRLFMKHFMSGQGLAGGFKPNLSETKKRQNLSMEERLALGEIRHPGITMRVALTRMGRDVASLNFLGEIAKNPDWFHPRSTIDFNGKKVTPDWLRAEAIEVRDRAAKIKEFNPDQAAEMNKLADDMDAAARSHSHGEYDPKEWKKMPDTKQYGALRGGYVRKQIADDITGMTDFVDENSWAAQLLGDKNSAISKATQYWKSLKVPMNIASHGRNFIGNMIQLHVFGGIPPHKVFSYILSASRQMRDNGKAWQVAKQYGIPHGNMGEAEFRALADSLAKSMDKVSLNGPTPYLAMWRGFENVREKMQDFYQKSESLFKTAVIAYELDKNTSPREAALRADDAIFDYGRVSPSIKYLRNNPLGAPFVCVDPATEILTQRGWLHVDDLMIGDMAASFSMRDERLHWKPVDDIYRAPYSGKMVHVNDRHLDMFMTPQHRVVTYRKRRLPGARSINGKYMSLELQEAKNLTQHDHIPVAASFDHKPVGEPITDAMAEFMGWFIAEGHLHKKCKAVHVFQNEGAKANAIRDVMKRAGFRWSERSKMRPERNNNTIVKFYISASYGKKIRALSPDKNLSSDLVMRMTKQQLRLFIDAFIAGDGHISKDGRKVIIQKNKKTLDNLQMALTILGHSYGFHHRDAAPIITIRDLTRYCIKRGMKPDVQYDGEIWCPKIRDLGTWVARRNNKVFITHNTWTYKAMPMLVKTMTDPKTMHRYLPYIALGALVPALVASMNDLKDDDPERLRKALSEALRRKASMYLLPWKDMNGRWQFLDVGYFLPWQMPQEVFTALSQGKVDEALKATPLLSSPVINIVTAIKTGEDPFTGRPIMDKKDPPYDQVVSLMKYLWDMATPSVLSSYGMAGKAYDAMTGSGTNRYGEPPADWAQIVARGAGLNTYSVDPEAQRGRNLRKMQHDIQDIRSQMTLNMKDQSLTPDQRKALMERFLSKIKDRQEEMMKYSRESAMTPSLSAATNRR